MKRQIFESFLLAAIVFAGLAFLVISFHPRARFAHPEPDLPALPLAQFHCYHDRIYGLERPADVLFFGTSRTLYAMHPDFVQRAYQAIDGGGERVNFFTMGGANPGLAYSFLRDYLENNPPPQAVLVELSPGDRMEPSVRYVHATYPAIAPAYLYLDELQSWSFVRGGLFAVSDFLRLLVRHIDLGLTNLLVAERNFMIADPGENCGRARSAMASRKQAPPARQFESVDSFRELMESEAELLLPPGGWQKAGDYDLLLQQYQGTAGAGRLERYGPGWSRNSPVTLWYRGPIKERKLYYYRQIVELGKAHGVNVEFFFLPSIYLPEPAQERIVYLENMLGAPVHTLPFRYARTLNHHYLDWAHIKPRANGLTSSWAASLMDRALDD